METEEKETLNLCSMPEAVVAHILTLTSPRDVCRLSTVSKAFYAATHLDYVWEKFIPFNWENFISHPYKYNNNSKSTPSSKKDLFFQLCGRSHLIDEGRKRLSLDQWSGKKWLMIGARDLKILGSNDPNHWSWTTHPSSRFSEVTILEKTSLLHINARIDGRSMLSPSTTYEIFLVFMTMDPDHGFIINPASRIVTIANNKILQKFCSLEPYCSKTWQIKRNGKIWCPEKRSDFWFEKKLGEFHMNEEEEFEVKICIWNYHIFAPIGLIVEGIEVRPNNNIEVMPVT